mgnify:CR=1 FL=1|jgi:uncharacterized membrane protein (DUF373 family)
MAFRLEDAYILAGGGFIYLLLIFLPLLTMYTGLLALSLNNDWIFSLFEILVQIYLLILSLVTLFLLHSLLLQGHPRDCRRVIDYGQFLRED